MVFITNGRQLGNGIEHDDSKAERGSSTSGVSFGVQMILTKVWRKQDALQQQQGRRAAQHQE